MSERPEPLPVVPFGFAQRLRADSRILARAEDPGEISRVLRGHPWLAAALRQDRAEGRFLAWGDSTAVDENIGAPVLSDPLIQTLCEWAGLAGNRDRMNAGLLHVYGYLFSDVHTPYGLKSDRWLHGELARALGQDATFFLPDSAERSPLSRITTALATALRAADAIAARGLDNPRIVADLHDTISDTLRCRTLLYRADGSDSGPCALIYTADTGLGPRLITAFPVHGDTAELIHTLRSEPSRLRYNAVSAR